MRNIFLSLLFVMLSVTLASAEADNDSIIPKTDFFRELLNSVEANAVSNPRSYGHKGFKWGMSAKEVQSIIPISVLPIRGANMRSLEEIGNAINGATAFFIQQFGDGARYDTDLPVGPNGEPLTSGLLPLESGRGTVGLSIGKNNYNSFFFVNDKLVGVSVGFSPAYKGKASYKRHLSDIISQYGRTASPIALTFNRDLKILNSKDERAIYVGWVAKGKIIVLAQRSFGGEFSDSMFEVSYVDINWYRDLLSSFIAKVD